MFKKFFWLPNVCLKILTDYQATKQSLLLSGLFVRMIKQFVWLRTALYWLSTSSGTNGLGLRKKSIKSISYRDNSQKKSKTDCLKILKSKVVFTKIFCRRSLMLVS